MTIHTRVRPLRSQVRTQILRAAREEFGEHGYAGASVAQVSARAGFTKGAVYSNFGGKPQLFAAAMQAYFAELVGRAFTDALTAARTSASAPARAMAEALARDVVRGERWPALLAEFRYVAVQDPELRGFYTDLRRTQRVELIEALHAAGEQVPLRPGLDLEVAVTLLLTCVQGLSAERAAAPAVLPNQLVEDLLTQVLDGILA